MLDCVELLMSVLPLLTIWISSSDRDLVRSKFSISISLTNADSLDSYRVMHSYSSVEAIEYEFSLSSYCYNFIKHTCSS